MAEKAPSVAVVGGGISGLAAARRLLQAGAEVTLVEKSLQLGGKIVTEHVDGFLIEGGPDSFVAGKMHVVDLADELGLGARLISSRPEHRGSSVWWEGRLHPLPAGLLLMVPSRLLPVFRSSLLTWKGKLRLLGDLVAPRRPGNDESLESFVVRRLGREVLERIAEPMVAGIHAAEPSTMSLAASFPRFLDMEREHGSLILAARSAATSAAPTGELSYFASFKGGMGDLSDALAREVSAAAIRMGAAVSELVRDGAGYRLRLDDGGELAAQGVVLATPAPDTAALLSPILSEAATAVAGIGQVATATVTLGYLAGDLPKLTGSGFVVPTAQRRKITGVSYLSRKWAGRVPDSRFELLRAFVGGTNGQELALAEEDRLVAAVRAELEALIGITATPVLTRTFSWRQALHQYRLGHLDLVARAEAHLTPGLSLAGAGFHGIGLNECVESGRRAADRVLATVPQVA